jgi:hypothetical protein
MAAILLTMCGIFLLAYGTWRSWSNGRELLLPAVHPDEGASRRRSGGVSGGRSAGRPVGSAGGTDAAPGPAGGRAADPAADPAAGPDSGLAPAPSAWAQIRHAVWRLALAVAWLMVAMLGLFMLSVAGEVRA